MFSKNFSIAVAVSDGKKSAKWYEEKLGLEVSTANGHWITAGAKGGPWKMHLCETDLDPGNTGIAFYVDDVKKAVADLKKKGVKFTKDSGESAMFEDPDGNVFWVMKGGP